MKILLSTFIISVLLLSVPVYAFSTLYSNHISLTIERGAEQKTIVLVQNVDTEIRNVTFSSSGQIGPWITFVNYEHTYTINLMPYIPTSIPIKITVPPEIEIGEYKGEIKANEEIITDVTVKVTLPINEILTLQELADVNKMFSDFKKDMQGLGFDINSTRETLLEGITQVALHQKNITELEEEKSELLNEVSELENKTLELELTRDKLTGMLPLSQASMFLSGLVLGIILMFLFSRFGKIGKRKEKRSEKSRESSKGNRREFKFQFKPKRK